VDYKTGKKTFSLQDVWYGMGLQMLLYLFALEEGGEARYGAPVEPAGIMYIPARSPILSLPSDDESEHVKKQAEALRRSGLVCGDEALIEAWERGEDKRFIPIKISRGKVAGGIADAEELSLLSRHIRRTLGEMAQELHRGSIDADPYYRSEEQQACKHCDFLAVCHFTDGENGESCRYLPKLSDNKVWGMLGEEGMQRA
jgi:ATP-dependent helicase/nuclease subunit B